MYKLYTFPNCCKCHEAKRVLGERKIPYEERNSGLGAGKKEFQEFYKAHRELIQRDASGQIILPILVSDNQIFQGIEKIALAIK